MPTSLRPSGSTSPLARLAWAAQRLAENAERSPGQWIRWTPPQQKFLGTSAKRWSLRAGNQFGKSWVGLYDMICRCVGEHPFQAVRKPPIEAWVVCTSWAQSVAIMRKFHGLCPPEYIDHRASSVFSIRAGYGKDNPAVIFRCGSVLRFRTTRQGAEALQGATVHHVLIDEPTDIDIYRELDRRLLRTGGTMALTFTPANRDCTWIRELVEQGVITEVHAKLTAANLTPEGAAEPLRLDDGTLMDEEWIAEQWRITPPAFAPVVLDGAWEMRPEGVFFGCFDRTKHINASARLDPNRGQVRWLMGIDYAAADRDFGQTAVLLQAQRQTSQDGRNVEAIIVHDAVVLSGVSTNEQFATEVLRMLERQGLRWQDIHEVHGDNPVMARWAVKSNIETMKAIAREIRVPYTGLQPRIMNAKEGKLAAGAVDMGARYLYQRISQGLFLVHPRCESIAQAFETWDYTRDHPAKDRIDAIRYALKGHIFPRGRSGTVVRVA